MVISVRFSDEQAECVRRQAERENMRVSDFIRTHIDQYLAEAEEAARAAEERRVREERRARLRVLHDATAGILAGSALGAMTDKEIRESIRGRYA